MLHIVLQFYNPLPKLLWGGCIGLMAACLYIKNGIYMLYQWWLPYGTCAIVGCITESS